MLAERYTGRARDIEVLELFDFDDTLFRSPFPPGEVPAGDTHTAWWAHPKSLGPAVVGQVPEADWWVAPVVKAARKAIADPRTFTALVSGRAGYEKALKKRVEQLLKDKGLDFDEVHLNPSTEPTVQWKVRQGRDMLHRLPDVRVLRVWDDRADILNNFEGLADELGLEFQPKLVVPKESVSFMNPTINETLKSIRSKLTESDAHATAGGILQQAMDDLITQRNDISEEIAALEKAWTEWDFDYLLKKRYLSSSLVKALKAERDYVYGK